MKKKTIPFDISKMKPDFSNVVYRDGTRPLFVCERKDCETWTILSIDAETSPTTHIANGLCYDNRETTADLLLEVEQQYPSLEELTEEQKELMKAFATYYIVSPSETFTKNGFDKTYTNFLNSQEK